MTTTKVGTKHPTTTRPAEAAKTKPAATTTPAKPAAPVTKPKVSDSFNTTPARPTTRPGSVRDAGELAVAWRAVHLTETSTDYNGVNPGSGSGSLNETSTQYWPHVNQDFRDHVAGDLKNFLQYGNSSLTPYETNRLTMGLFGSHVDNHGYGEAENYHIGDRVEFSSTNAQGKSVTQRGIYYGTGVMTAMDGKFAMIPLMNPNGDRPLVINKLVAGALNDGRY